MFTLKDIWPGERGAEKPTGAQKTAPGRTEPEKCPATGKYRHKTRGEALAWRDSLYVKNPDCYLEVYRCKHWKGCGDWHVGNR
jgi:hypothetical protein